MSIEKQLICICWQMKYIGNLKLGQEVAITGHVSPKLSPMCVVVQVRVLG